MSQQTPFTPCSSCEDNYQNPCPEQNQWPGSVPGDCGNSGLSGFPGRPGPPSFFDRMLDRFNQFLNGGTVPNQTNSPTTNKPADCGLKAHLASVTRGTDGKFTVVLTVSGQTGPVETSLNRQTWTPNLTFTGLMGVGVVIFLQERHRPGVCTTAIYVELPISTCLEPPAPTVVVTNNTCTGGVGAIELTNVPEGVIAHWYASPNGTGAALTSPPAYRSDQIVSGSVRFARTGVSTCLSVPSQFTTAPVQCACTAVRLLTQVLPDAVVGRPYSFRIGLAGTAPFSLGEVNKPVWLSVAVQGSELVLSGTPTSGDRSLLSSLSVEVRNCGASTGTPQGVTTLSGQVPVRTSCAEVGARWVVEQKRCHTCSNTPMWRIISKRCHTPEPCTAPVKNGTTLFKRLLDNKGELTIDYGTSSDTLLVRLLETGQTTPVWTGQTTGGAKTLPLNYTLPNTAVTYVLTIERIGQARCRATETGMTPTAPAIIQAPALVCGFGNILMVSQTGNTGADAQRSFAVLDGVFTGTDLRYELWDRASGLNLTVADESGFVDGQVVLSNYREVEGEPRENPYTLILVKGIGIQVRQLRLRAKNSAGQADYDFGLTSKLPPTSSKLGGIIAEVIALVQGNNGLRYTARFLADNPLTVTLTPQSTCNTGGSTTKNTAVVSGKNQVDFADLREGYYLVSLTGSDGSTETLTLDVPSMGQARMVATIPEPVPDPVFVDSGDMIESDVPQSLDTVTRAIYRRQSGNFSPPQKVSVGARTAELGHMEYAIQYIFLNENDQEEASALSNWQPMEPTNIFQDTNRSMASIYALSDRGMVIYLRPTSNPQSVRKFQIPLPGHDVAYQVASLTVVSDPVVQPPVSNRAYKAVKLTVTALTGWAVNVIRYWLYDPENTCAEAMALFRGLTLAEKLAQTSPTIPAANAKKVWGERNCGETPPPVTVTPFVPDEDAGPGSDLIDDPEYSEEPPVATVTPFVPDEDGGLGTDLIDDPTYTPPTEEPPGDEEEPPVGDTGFDTTYAFSQAGSDYAGRAFVSSPAPVITGSARSKPRLTGNDYAFPMQTAHNAILAKRFPPFSLPWLVVYQGPGFAQQDNRDAIMTRGFGGVGPATPNRGLFSRNKIAAVVNGGYEVVAQLANELETANSSDIRIQWLREWENRSLMYLIDHQPSAYAFGYRFYQVFQNSDWTNGQPLLGITPNFEVNAPNPRGANPDYQVQWRNMVGYFMQGVKQAAIDAGHTPPRLINYDEGFISHYGVVVRSRDQEASGVYGDLNPPVNYTPEVGIPYYFSYKAIGDTWGGGTPTAPLTANNPLAAYTKANGDYAGSVEYMKNTWPENVSLWQKESNGSFKTRVVNNVTLLVPRNDAFQGVVGGETTTILGAGYFSVGEADNFLRCAYERLQNAVTDTYFRAGGKHLSLSNERQAGWENLKLVQWARHDAEFKQGNEVTKPDNSGPSIDPATNQPYDVNALNLRPLNADWQEGDVMWHLLAGRDAYRFWMGPQAEFTAQGVSVTGDNHSRASHEAAIKGMHRMSQFGWLATHTTRYIIPQYLIRNLDRYRAWYDPREEFEKKPAFIARLCDSRTDRGNKPYIVMGGWYLAQDPGQTSDWLYWWVDAQGNPITGSYKIRLTGRKFFAEEHQLPDAVAGLDPSRMRIQGTDMTGQTLTLTGDYRTARITDHPTPPALS